MSLTYTEDRDRVIAGDYDVSIGRQSLCFASVCVRDGVDLHEAAAYLPPSGTTGGWCPVEPEDMEPGMEPMRCPDHPTHTHHAYAC